MKSRTRRIAAHLALLALALFWVEGVWASMCSPAISMGATNEARVHSSDTAGTDMADMDMPDDGSEEGHAPEPNCPLTPAGGAACTAGALLGTRVQLLASASPEASRPVGSSDHAKDLLLAVALFHPPRA